MANGKRLPMESQGRSDIIPGRIIEADVTQTLVSMGQLESSGLVYTVDGDKRHFIDSQGEIKLTATLDPITMLYKIDPMTLLHSSTELKVAQSAATDSRLWASVHSSTELKVAQTAATASRLWASVAPPPIKEMMTLLHAGFSHIPMDRMLKVLKLGLIKNLPPQVTAKAIRKHWPHCKACIVGGSFRIPPTTKKMTAAPAIAEIASVPMEVIDCDELPGPDDGSSDEEDSYKELVTLARNMGYELKPEKTPKPSSARPVIHSEDVRGVGQMVSLDIKTIAGTANTDVSSRGNRYMLVVRDRYSKMISLAFLKTREEAAEGFERIIDEYALEGHIIGTARADNEFSGSYVEDLATAHNAMKIQRSAPGDHCQNGFGESAIKTVVVHGRINLTAAPDSYPKDEWEEAMLHATMGVNVTTLSSDGKTSAWEMFHREPFDFKRFPMLPFGMEVETLNEKEHLDALDPRTESGHYLGASTSHSEVARIRDADTGKVKLRRTFFGTSNVLSDLRVSKEEILESKTDAAPKIISPAPPRLKRYERIRLKRKALRDNKKLILAAARIKKGELTLIDKKEKAEQKRKDNEVKAIEAAEAKAAAKAAAEARKMQTVELHAALMAEAAKTRNASKLEKAAAREKRKAEMAEATKERKNAKKAADKAAGVLQYEDKVAIQAAHNAQMYRARQALKSTNSTRESGANISQPNPSPRWARALHRKQVQTSLAKIRADNEALRADAYSKILLSKTRKPYRLREDDSEAGQEKRRLSREAHEKKFGPKSEVAKMLRDHLAVCAGNRCRARLEKPVEKKSRVARRNEKLLLKVQRQQNKLNEASASVSSRRLMQHEGTRVISEREAHANAKRLAKWYTNCAVAKAHDEPEPDYPDFDQLANLARLRHKDENPIWQNACAVAIVNDPEPAPITNVGEAGISPASPFDADFSPIPNQAQAYYYNPDVLLADPEGWKKMKAHPNKAGFLEAVDIEIKQITGMDGYNIVDKKTVPKGAKIIDTMFKFVTKRKNGVFVKFKARLVARGDQQVGVRDTYAPTVHTSTLRMLLAVAATKGLQVSSLDIASAFLIENMDEDVYIRLPSGYTDDNNMGETICKLNKSLYGLCQAPRIFHNGLVSHLKEQGYKRCVHDPCLFIKTMPDGSALFAAIHVDDILVMSDSIVHNETLKDDMEKKYKISWEPETDSFLGLTITRDRAKRSITISQPAYARHVVAQCNMIDCIISDTPADHIKFTGTSAGKGDSKELRKIIGLLQYLTITRPDIMTAVNKVAKTMHDPTEEDMIAARKIVRYIAGTLDHGITFGNANNTEVVLVAYADASHRTDKKNVKDVSELQSRTGNAFFIGNKTGAFAFLSQCQDLTAQSSQEAEIISLSEATRSVMHFRLLLEEMGFKQENPTIIYEDNNAAISFANGQGDFDRTKHIEIKHRLCVEKVEDGHITVTYVDTTDQIADIFTKNLPPPEFKKIRHLLLNQSIV